MPFVLESPAFSYYTPIPTRYTADGNQISPPLRWSGAPDKTKAFALLCEDPDAPLPRPFVHWVIYGLSANTSSLPEGLPAVPAIHFPVSALQGLNTQLEPGWTGPKPPSMHHAHRYVFRIFALRRPLELPDRAGRTEFLEEIHDKILAEAHLIGLYERPFARNRRRIAFGTACVAALAAGIAGGRRFKAAILEKSRTSKRPNTPLAWLGNIRQR